MAQKSNDKPIELTIPAKPEYLRIVRLLVAGYASYNPVTIDEVENLKVAVCEVCNNMMSSVKGNGTDDTIKIRCYRNDNFIIFEISNKGVSSDYIWDVGDGDTTEQGLGFLLIQTLMDKVDVKSHAGKGTKITLYKKTS